MREIEAELDWNVPIGSPTGTFRVIRLTDNAGSNLLGLLEANAQFPSLEALRLLLAAKIGDEVALIEANSAR